MEGQEVNPGVDMSFEAVDTNNDGVISRDEHKAALQRTASSDPSFRASEDDPDGAAELTFHGIKKRLHGQDGMGDMSDKVTTELGRIVALRYNAPARASHQIRYERWPCF